MKFGLIGHPISHSLSPALFKAGYEGRYPYELIESDCFEEAYRRFLKDYDGINVTAPFKELAVAKADILSEECRLTGATNLLVKTPEGVKAFNSDFLGVRMWLQNVAPSQVCRPSVLVVGTGGAGKAAAAAALTLGLNVTLMNRSREKAERLAADFSMNGYHADVEDLCLFSECFRKADIIIYNIPAAVPEIDVLSSDDFCPGSRKLILEANYRNPSFDEEKIAEIKEAEYTGGKTWLLYQALTGYEIFTGEVPDLEKMSAVL